MSFLNGQRKEEPVQRAQALHALAQQKVAAAMAKLGRPALVEPVPDLPRTPQAAPVAGEAPPAEPEVPDAEHETEDPVVQQALDRMHEHLGDVCALDRDGRELTWVQLVRVVVGPRTERSRSTDVVPALQAVVAAEEPVANDHIFANLVAERRHRAETVNSQHETLNNGAHRYVFRADEVGPWSDAARVREERLITTLENRYPGVEPTDKAG